MHLIIHSSHINNDMFYLSSHNPVLSSFIIYYRVWSRVIRQVPHVEQELLTLPLYMSSLRFLVGLVLLDLWFSVDSFVDHYLSLFCHCIVCPSSICGFWLSFDILKLFSHSKCCWYSIDYEQIWAILYRMSQEYPSQKGYPSKRTIRIQKQTPYTKICI